MEEKKILLDLLELLGTKYLSKMQFYSTASWIMAFVFGIIKLIYFGYTKYIDLYSKHLDFEEKKKNFKRKLKDEKPSRIIT
jgi:hypothetical protein